MRDGVYPSSKPNSTTTAATTNPLSFPATKSQLYNPYRPPYRHQPNQHRRRHRSCLCPCCFWSILLVTALLLLLSAIGGATVYVVYRPTRPKFSVSALRISKFYLSTVPDDTTRLTSALNLTISSKNPNQKLIFFYDPITINSNSNQVTIANGSFPSFTSNPSNITIIHCSMFSSSQAVDADSVTSLRLDLKRKTGLPLKIWLDTKVVVKMDGLKSNKVGIRVTCDGIHSLIPKGNSSPSVATTSDAKCKVDVRIKILKWTILS